MKTNAIDSRYDMIHYDGQQNLSVKTITRDDVLALDRTVVDYFLSVDLGIWGFRKPNGEWVENSLSDRSMGNTCLKIIECLQCDPGVFFSPGEISALTDLFSLGFNNNLSARLRAIRSIHDESHKTPNFFLSKRTGGFGVAWNSEKSFMQIIKVKEIPNKPCKVQ